MAGWRKEIQGIVTMQPGSAYEIGQKTYHFNPRDETKGGVIE
ncbi:hypothetical protein [Escherichia phage vB_EcoM_swi3]|uniref:Uncharacterized protein n=1 Tax=Escherichia phage vB_EcoM_swi3 TaxID=2769807 RepID=A0A862QDH4_9CAUD|nr:hypothetical protein LSE7621_00030 [Salmonella phage LSE7621]QFR58233.1 hypothetical protein [Salmonella phage 8-19]QNR52405.1 hypothetical protein [Escherichia phage vB_EcoM_swi3]